MNWFFFFSRLKAHSQFKKLKKDLLKYPDLPSLEKLVVLLLNAEKDFSLLLFSYIAELSDILPQLSFHPHAISQDTEYCRHVVICLLRLGLLEEAIYLIKNGILSLPPEEVEILEFSSTSIKTLNQPSSCPKKGKTIIISTIVWGEEFLNNFLEFGIKSMLAEDNLPLLSRYSKLIYFISTTDSGRSFIQKHPIFPLLQKYVEVKFLLIPPSVLQGVISKNHSAFYVYYGLLDHLSIYYAQTMHAHIFMIPPDAIASKSAFSEFKKYIDQGYWVGGSGTLISTPAILECFSTSKEEPISLSGEELANLALEHPHPFLLCSVMVSTCNTNFSKHARDLLWSQENGIVIHSVFFHPIFISNKGLKTYQYKHLANVDYGLIPRLTSSIKKIKVFSDLSPTYMASYSPTEHCRQNSSGGPYCRDTFIKEHTNAYAIQKKCFQVRQFIKCNASSYGSLPARVEEVKKILKIWKIN